MTPNERINNHNGCIAGVKPNVYSVQSYNLITTGAKRKKFCLYHIQSYYEQVVGEYGATKKMVNVKDKKFICYLPLDYEKAIAEAVKLSKGIKLTVEVASLSESKTKDIPKWKFIKFGRYKYTNVDEIPSIDISYAKWLIKSTKERKEKDAFGYSTEFMEYVLSPSFIDIITKIESEINNKKQK